MPETAISQWLAGFAQEQKPRPDSRCRLWDAPLRVACSTAGSNVGIDVEESGP